jgi:hypothetical protein
VSHLKEAFLTADLPMLELIKRDAEGQLRLDLVDLRFEPAIEATRSLWEAAPPFPDLYRRRDRDAFRAVARSRRWRIFVQPVPRAAARWIGEAHCRPIRPGQWGFPRVTEPHAGCVAADPGDARLGAALDRSRKSWGQHVAELSDAGLVVGPPEDGYILRDSAGAAFYAAYALHSIRGPDGKSPRAADELQQALDELNQRMGERLVQSGPHDRWSLRQPHSVIPPPLLVFEPDGNVEVIQSSAALRVYAQYHQLDMRWVEGRSDG